MLETNMVSRTRRERRREQAGLTAVLLVTSILMTWSGAGAVCVGREVAVDRGEAVVRCSLTTDVRTRMHGIIIKHFTNSTSYPEQMMGCYWFEPNKLECRSDFGFKLMEPLTDLVMAKVPKTKLREDGSYRCQLLPPDFDQPFTPCEIFHSDDPEDPPTTDRPVGPSPPADLSESVPGASEKPLTDDQEDPPTIERPASPSPPAEKPLKGLVVAVVVLAFTVIILLLLDIGFILCYVHIRGRAKPRREQKKLMNGTC